MHCAVDNLYLVIDLIPLSTEYIMQWNIKAYSLGTLRFQQLKSICNGCEHNQVPVAEEYTVTSDTKTLYFFHILSSLLVLTFSW